MKKRLVSILLVTLALLLFVSACSSTGTNNGDGVGKDTLVVGMGADAKIRPTTNDQASSRVTRQIYDTLIVQTEDLDLVPGLATEWEYKTLG